jgi:hypothetical protein
LDVVANPAAEAFYRAMGFEVIGTAETRFGPADIMRNSIMPRDRDMR